MSRGNAPTHLVIRASAGTGKTYRLAMRCIALLALGEPPRSLLATTFTRKAAGEMLDRVLKFLAEGALGGGRLEELREHARPELTSATCMAILRSLVDALGELRIGTIDSLLHRVASGSAFSIGIAPGWKILSDAEADELTLQVLGEMLDDVPRNQREDLLQRLRQVNGDSLNSSVHTPLLRIIKDCAAAFRETGGVSAPWERVGPASKPLKETELNAAVEAAHEALKHAPLKKDGTPHAAHLKAIAAAIERAKDGRWEELAESTLIASLGQPEPMFSKIAVPAKVAELLQPLRRQAVHVLLTRLAERNAAAHEILTGFDTRLDAAKQAASTYTFDDIPRLLLAAPFAGGLDHTFFALDSAVRHVMLDEFQDTSRVQFQLMRLLLDEVHQSDDGRTMFFVGDSKQSLYSWRGGTPELLDHLGHTESPYPELPEQDLVMNYRSGTRIISCVNDVFATIATNQALQADGKEAAEHWAPRFSPHVAHAGAQAGSVRISIVRPPGADETAREAMARAAAGRIAELHRAFPHASIAVLVRSKGSFASLKHELTRHGIEASQEGVSALVDSPAVASVISLLHLVAHPADSAAAYAVAHSPLGALLGYADHANRRATLRLVRRARRTIARRTLPRVLNKIARLLTPSTDERSSRRLFQLAMFAATDGTGGDLDRFVQRARKHTLHDTTDAPVRLMTIHAAKGLEFDIVVLPDLDASWTRHGMDLLTRRPDAFSPPELITLSPSPGLRASDPEMEALYAQNRQHRISEELSVLYVALTRPVHHLEILLKGDRKRAEKTPTSSRGVIAAALGLEERLAWPADLSGHRPGSDTIEIHSKGVPSVPISAPRHERAAEVKRLSLAPRGDIALGARRRVSPSGLEGKGSIELRELLEPASEALTVSISNALEKGRALHALFEQIEWSDVMPEEAALRQALTALGVAQDRVPDVLAEFAQIASNPAVRGLMARPKGTCVVRREWAFLCPQTLADGSEVLLDGRFDRVQIELDGEGRPIGAHVIDFKTDAATEGEGASRHAERTEHYTPQLQAYARALALLLKLPMRSIRATLLFTSTCTVVSVPISAE